MSAALRMRGIRKRFRRQTALRDFNLDLRPGSVVGLVGSNGAGKTTAMAIALGFLRPDAGAVDVLGGGPFDARLHRGRVGVLPQDAALPPEATPRTWLTGLARLQGMDGKAARREAERWLADLHLDDRAESMFRTLSHGMRKRVMVAQALMGEPELVLLDEPLSGVDPREADALRRMVATRRDGRGTMLISSHDLAEIERTCDTVVLVERGTTVQSVEVGTLGGTHRGHIVYRLTAPPPMARLEALGLGAAFEWNDRGGELHARLAEGSRTDLAAANDAVLRLLLDHGIGVLAVDPGSRVEALYLDRPPAHRR